MVKVWELTLNEVFYKSLTFSSIWLLKLVCFGYKERNKKSLLSLSAIKNGSVPDAIKVLSSAKISISLSRSSLMSFMYNKNNKGPSLEPCGTPALMSVTSLM